MHSRNGTVKQVHNFQKTCEYKYDQTKSVDAFFYCQRLHGKLDGG